MALGGECQIHAQDITIDHSDFESLAVYEVERLEINGGGPSVISVDFSPNATFILSGSE